MAPDDSASTDGTEPPDRQELGPDRQELGPDRQELGPDRQELGPDRQELGSDRQEFVAPTPSSDLQGQPMADRRELLAQLPNALVQDMTRLGARPRQDALRSVIRRLCTVRELTAVELGGLLDIRPDNLTRRHLSPMVERGELERRYPDAPSHPEQAYRARTTPLTLFGEQL